MWQLNAVFTVPFGICYPQTVLSNINCTTDWNCLLSAMLWILKLPTVRHAVYIETAYTVRHAVYIETAYCPPCCVYWNCLLSAMLCILKLLTVRHALYIETANCPPRSVYSNAESSNTECMPYSSKFLAEQWIRSAWSGRLYCFENRLNCEIRKVDDDNYHLSTVRPR
jgi:hypothetical protein